MAELHRQRIGHQLMVGTLEDSLIVVFFLILDQTTAVPRVEPGAVDLVEREPVIHQTAQPLIQGLAVAQIEVDHLAVLPAAVLRDEVHRRCIVQNGGKHLHATLVALGKQIDVIADAFFVGLGIVAVGVDACPADGGTENFKPQFLHQGQILLVRMVEIDTPAERIVLDILCCQRRFKTLGRHVDIAVFAALRCIPVGIKHSQILGIQPFAAFIPGTFCLRGGNSSAP